jgi:hypothetical protein
LILLASLNKSSAGFMSVLLQKFQAQLPDLSYLADTGGNARHRTCPPSALDSVREITFKSCSFLQEATRKIMAALADVGMENHYSGETDSGQRFLAVWGGTSAFGPNPARGSLTSQESVFPSGIFDIEAVSQYSLAAGLGAFESLLLLTPQARITLDRSNSDPPVYLLCSFPESYAEGLLRAKARRAISFLE